MLALLNICLCQVDQSYRLVNKYDLNKAIKVSSGTSTEMRFKGIDIVTNFSAILNTTLVDSTDESYKFNLMFEKITIIGCGLIGSSILRIINNNKITLITS